MAPVRKNITSTDDSHSSWPVQRDESLCNFAYFLSSGNNWFLLSISLIVVIPSRAASSCFSVLIFFPDLLLYLAGELCEQFLHPGQDCGQPGQAYKDPAPGAETVEATTCLVFLVYTIAWQEQQDGDAKYKVNWKVLCTILKFTAKHAYVVAWLPWPILFQY